MLYGLKRIVTNKSAVDSIAALASGWYKICDRNLEELGGSSPRRFGWSSSPRSVAGGGFGVPPRRGWVEGPKIRRPQTRTKNFVKTCGQETFING